MTERITVYVSPDLHCLLKITASSRGMTLSGFMVQAAQRALETPDRSAAAHQMDLVRQVVSQRASQEELSAIRRQGRRY